MSIGLHAWSITSITSINPRAADSVKNILQSALDPDSCWIPTRVQHVEQYPWVVPYLLIKAATRQATRTLDDRNKSVMRRITPMSTDDRHDGASHRLAVTRTSYLRSLRRTPQKAISGTSWVVMTTTYRQLVVVIPRIWRPIAHKQ